MSESQAQRGRPEWHTVAVEVLPVGWRNAFEDEGAIEYWPCPALLVQECRRTVRRGPGEVDIVEMHKPPYEVRVVFADQDNGILEPANDAGTTSGLWGRANLTSMPVLNSVGA